MLDCKLLLQRDFLQKTAFFVFAFASTKSHRLMHTHTHSLTKKEKNDLNHPGSINVKFLGAISRGTSNAKGTERTQSIYISVIPRALILPKVLLSLNKRPGRDTLHWRTPGINPGGH